MKRRSIIKEVRQWLKQPSGFSWNVHLMRRSAQDYGNGGYENDFYC